MSEGTSSLTVFSNSKFGGDRSYQIPIIVGQVLSNQVGFQAAMMQRKAWGLISLRFFAHIAAKCVTLNHVKQYKLYYCL